MAILEIPAASLVMSEGWQEYLRAGDSSALSTRDDRTSYVEFYNEYQVSDTPNLAEMHVTVDFPATAMPSGVIRSIGVVARVEMTGSEPMGLQMFPPGVSRIDLPLQVSPYNEAGTERVWKEYSIPTPEITSEMVEAGLSQVPVFGWVSGGFYAIFVTYLALRVEYDPLPTVPANNAHHGTKVVRFTAGPQPDPITETLTDQVGTYLPSGPTSPTPESGAAPTVVGTEPVWADGSDDSYAVADFPQTGTSSAPMSPLDLTDLDGAEISAMTLRVRLSTTTSRAAGLGRQVSMRLLSQQDPSGHDVGWTFDVPDDDLVHDVVVDLVPNGPTGWPLDYDLPTLLAMGPSTIDFASIHADATTTWSASATIYEVAIDATYSITRTVQPPGDPCEAIPKGPNDDRHHGSFQMDPSTGTISAQIQAGIPEGDDPVWVQPWAHYQTWDPDAGVLLSVASEPVGDPMLVSGPNWVEINVFHRPTEVVATHWQLGVRFTATDPREPDPVRLPQGQVVYLECTFVPDNGMDVSQEPYLDGDQPGAIWEGVPHNSTSIYGTPPPTDLAKILVLDEELNLGIPVETP